MITIQNKNTANTARANGDMILRKVKSIVLHWKAAPGQSNDSTIAYLEKVQRSYHWMIDGTVVDQLLEPPQRAIHCGAFVYSDYAIKKFGRYCPSWDHRIKPHNSSPNWVAIGICMAHEDWDGKMKPETIDTTAKMVARCIKLYTPHLTEEDVDLHGLISDDPDKDCPKYFIDNPKQFLKFKGLVKRYIETFDPLWFQEEK